MTTALVTIGPPLVESHKYAKKSLRMKRAVSHARIPLTHIYALSRALCSRQYMFIHPSHLVIDYVIRGVYKIVYARKITQFK